ncbi:hypothetical protein QFZ77_001081 [Paenibacillus sp. V4I3]|uniref:hypothetical protein n=1 Tax=unclassified Paenibacillus TaxID=185978 RepID=UPI00278825A2|nr:MULTISPECIES: hypothetical protein [unclassified Paenibacillus]MDQ0872422.1 hypothetical protein [Paenibacillus sp. V4I3]MDQ0891691.1 hypothetical protein [Paenibacillus sp. V4I9]
MAIRFDAGAAQEYWQLDISVLDEVNQAIDELSYRANEVGEELSHYSDPKCACCKEITLKEAGIRIVFRITNDVVEILRVVPASKIMTSEAPNYTALDHFPGNHRNEFILAIQKWKQEYEH